MAPCQGKKPHWAATGAYVLCVSLVLLLAAAPCCAQSAQPGDPEAGDALPLFSAQVLSRAALYVGVTVVCVAVFSLVFLKCWNDVNRALEDSDSPQVEDTAEEAEATP